MLSPPDPRSLEERLSDTEAILRQLAQAVGLGETTNDPARAWHFERSLLAHFSDMHRAFHDWNNTAQILLEELRQINLAVERGTATSQQNRNSLAQLNELARRIEDYSHTITSHLGLVTRDQPLLMRDLFWLETNPIEIFLILYAFGEAWVFLRGSADLLKTPTYRGLAMLIDAPLAWGGMLLTVTITAAIAFLCRRRKWRLVGAFGLALYFGLSGVMTLYISSSVLGWWPHILAGFSAFWILARGPSDAPA